MDKSIALASPWYPRGELPRLKRLLPRLRSLYGDQLFIALREQSPETADVQQWFEENQITYQLFEGWSGRHVCVKMAVEAGSEYLHYADFDRLLRWVECWPDELARVIQRIPDQDLLIMGRSEFAWRTHPRSMFETEALFNMIFSHYFGRDMDFGAGARGLSRRAGEFVLAHSSHAEALNMDAGWAVLLKRGGFAWDYVETDGLEWESADQHKETVASQEEQHDLAGKSDASARNWQLRTQVAHKIINFGIEAMNQPLEAKDK